MGGDAPALGILIDLPLGILMWMAILRFLLSMVLSEDGRTGPMRLLNAVVMPPMRMVALITPTWVIDRAAPLYLAFLLFILRYYVAPLIVSYDIYSVTSLPLEHLLMSAIAEFGF